VALPELTPANNYIFRITHRNNLPWIMANGLHCRKSPLKDPNFVAIGNPELIEKRHYAAVDQPPGGTISDYIPFYFTPRSMMALNINTGRNVPKRANSEIIILVSSLAKLKEAGIEFLFTDRHASSLVPKARFSSNLDHLDRIDWTILQNSDFRRDNDDIDKTSRYQAETLVHKSLPVGQLLGIACCDNEQGIWVDNVAKQYGQQFKVLTKQGWYF
jgi:hypothetical protein